MGKNLQNGQRKKILYQLQSRLNDNFKLFIII